jgi:hypothetical protein
MKRTALLCVALASASSWAQDHLEPEDAFYSTTQLDYRVAVGKVLGRALPYNLPKVIVLPSNQKEYIVGLAPEATGCAIVFGRADFLLWTYEGPLIARCAIALPMYGRGLFFRLAT